MMRKTVFSFLTAMAFAPAVWAETAILVIGNEDYDNLADVSGGDDVARDVRRLRVDETLVVGERNADAEAIREALRAFEADAEEAETLVVVLVGAFSNSASDTFFLATDARTDGMLSGQDGTVLPISVVTSYLGAAPGRAFLVLGTDEQDTVALDRFVTRGIGQSALPQGVTRLIGSVDAVSEFVRDQLGQPDVSVAEIAGIATDGFLPAGHAIYQSDRAPASTSAAPVSRDEDARRQDIADWRRALDADTAAAYRRYLNQHPNGNFVNQAEAALATLTRPVVQTPEDIETALELTRDQRRDIQRDLSLLDYDPRGIDGIFGPGSRAAVRRWQESQGLEATGFLTSDQIAILDRQASQRAAQLEEEARERRRQLLAADRAYWAETGNTGRASGYRAYLERYPDGEFAAIAQRRLNEIEAQRRNQANAEDRRRWDIARREDRIRSYRRYLDENPEGAFREQARARIRELRAAASREQENEDALRAENALNMSQVTRRVMEQRLARAGFNPGAQDGVFDQDTRRAIRRYQASRNLPQTGYLNEAVVVRLLADSVRSIFE